MPFSKATIVLDTSAVLEAPDLVKELYEHARAYDVDMLLPTTTIMELDRIKDREKVNSAKGIKTRKVINWINKTLTSEDVDAPVLRGQRLSERLNMRQSLKGDDAILDCCLYNVQYRRNLTILMSDDHNLRNRALVERLETLDTRAMSAGQILEAIRERTVGFMDLDTSFEYDTVPEVSTSEPKAFSGAQDTHTTNGQVILSGQAPALEVPAAAVTAGTAYKEESREQTPHSEPAHHEEAVLTSLDGGEMELEEVATAKSVSAPRDTPKVVAVAESASENRRGLEKSRWSKRAPKHQGSRVIPDTLKVHSNIIRPVQFESKFDTIWENVGALADWHLRQEHSAEDLEMLGYGGKPHSCKAVFQLIKMYYVPTFRYIVSRTTFDRAEAALSAIKSPEFLSSWAQLLLELARFDKDYVDLVDSLRLRL